MIMFCHSKLSSHNYRFLTNSANDSNIKNMVYMINIYIESKELVKLQAPGVKLQKSQKLKFPE